MLRRSVCITLAVLFVAGCSTMPKPPSCDGYSRRPLNKSMWEQAQTGVESSPTEMSDVAPVQNDEADEGPPATMVYTTAFRPDVEASLRACG